MLVLVVVLQARAAELRRQKAEHEKAWAAAQRERELQKVRAHCAWARPASLFMRQHPHLVHHLQCQTRTRTCCCMRMLSAQTDICCLLLLLQLAEEQELEKQAAVQAAERYR